MKRLSVAIAFCCVAALAAVPQPPAVKKLENLGFLTGAKAPGDTLRQGGVGSVIIYSLDILLFLFGISLLFHVQF